MHILSYSGREMEKAEPRPEQTINKAVPHFSLPISHSLTLPQNAIKTSAHNIQQFKMGESINWIAITHLTRWKWLEFSFPGSQNDFMCIKRDANPSSCEVKCEAKKWLTDRHIAWYRMVGTFEDKRVLWAEWIWNVAYSEVLTQIHWAHNIRISEFSSHQQISISLACICRTWFLFLALSNLAISGSASFCKSFVMMKKKTLNPIQLFTVTLNVYHVKLHQDFTTDQNSWD